MWGGGDGQVAPVSRMLGRWAGGCVSGAGRRAAPRARPKTCHAQAAGGIAAPDQPSWQPQCCKQGPHAAVLRFRRGRGEGATAGGCRQLTHKHHQVVVRQLLRTLAQLLHLHAAGAITARGEATGARTKAGGHGTTHACWQCDAACRQQDKQQGHTVLVMRMQQLCV